MAEDMFWDSAVPYSLDQGGVISSIRKHMNPWVKNVFFLCIHVSIVIIESCSYHSVAIYSISFHGKSKIFLLKKLIFMLGVEHATSFTSNLVNRLPIFYGPTEILYIPLLIICSNKVYAL